MNSAFNTDEDKINSNQSEPEVTSRLSDQALDTPCDSDDPDISVGTDVIEPNTTPAFEAIDKSDEALLSETTSVESPIEYVDQNPGFADGLADWDILPPNNFVRRP